MGHVSCFILHETGWNPTAPDTPCHPWVKVNIGVGSLGRKPKFYTVTLITMVTRQLNAINNDLLTSEIHCNNISTINYTLCAVACRAHDASFPRALTIGRAGFARAARERAARYRPSRPAKRSLVIGGRFVWD